MLARVLSLPLSLTQTHSKAGREIEELESNLNLDTSTRSKQSSSIKGRIKAVLKKANSNEEEEDDDVEDGGRGDMVFGSGDRRSRSSRHKSRTPA